jgi:spermidine synthase
MVLALFFGSGATALVYEVVWSKLLSQMFGSTVYAQTVVLAAFMGGLALGNRLFGRWADRLREPVQAYGCLEIAIGIYAFVFLTLDRMADSIFVSLGTHLVERAGLLLALKAVLSVALLLGPTILMGGTLPLLAAWLQKFSTDAGRRSARFYSVNSLGAVFGSALAGFWLVQQFGIGATLRITALANVVVGGAAIVLSRQYRLESSTAAAVPAAETPEAGSPVTLRWAGAIVALTGAVSMGLEVVSSRSLALIFGSSLQSFAVVLIAFILGIGLGSAWIASPRRKARGNDRLVVGLLVTAALWVALLVFNIERWTDFYRIARLGLGRTSVGYVYHQLLTTGMALVILGFPAACIGAVLPLMIRAVSAEGAPLGAKVGSLLTWNTLGAVAGSLFTGFVLMPHVGLRNAFAVLALGLAAGALVLAWRGRWRAGLAIAAGACLFVVSLFVQGNDGWQMVMSSGAFRVRETEFDNSLMPLRKKHMKIIFYEDAPDATVSVEEADGLATPACLVLRINGKADAGTYKDVDTQMLVAHLAMLVKPGAKDVFVLGLGSGITAGAVLGYPVERLDVAENCEPVIRAGKLFGDWNRHVLENPRTRMWCEDARTVLKLRPQLYDAIITVPSNPWTVGIGSVFSREFYELAARRLKPGGVVAQWFQVYEMQDDIVRLVLRTFSAVFPYLEVWDSGGGDLVLLGAKQPWTTGPEVFRAGFGLDRVRADLWMMNIQTPEALLGKQLASQRTGFAIAGPGLLQSDLFPILEYKAPRAFYLGAATRMLDRYDERTRCQLLAPPDKLAILRALPLINTRLLFSDSSTINGELWGCLHGTSLGEGVPCAFQTPAPAPPPGSEGGILAEAEKAFAFGDLDTAGQLATLALRQKPSDTRAGYILQVIDRAKQLQPTGAKSVATR